MVRSALTGTRIRERRTTLRIRQADLARSVGVSPAYLNLIEHNRRRVSDALLESIAQALGSDLLSLTEGAESALFDGLREVAAGTGATVPPELDRIEEFVGRFPGWAAALAERQDRVGTLERLVETYADRLAQDPFLLDALHEVLSVVTSLRSSAAILTETEDLEAEWRGRFLRAIGEESQRLSGATEALVHHLEGIASPETGRAAPRDELETWLAARDWGVPEEGAPAALSPPARQLAEDYIARARADAALLPEGPFLAALSETGPEPARLAARFGVPMGVVFRRLATLPGGRIAAGLVVCDGSGTLTLRRPVPGFTAPRFGAACPLWPLYEALNRPMQPVRAVLEMAGRVPRRFLAYAFAAPREPGDFDGPALMEAMMLVLPAPAEGAARPVGTTCRTCPRAGCRGRHEPSILPAGEG
ncbi:short-chain fatty acyl-CoA regulator family protein [Paenirhodobacter sp.]|uniref:short-chain fatty acyl-CoA regulator family protein n=1 Tax=Paenirhodobacter sp. TaxID=1965326 RepID=UPI003B3E8722